MCDILCMHFYFYHNFSFIKLIQDLSNELQRAIKKLLLQVSDWNFVS